MRDHLSFILVHNDRHKEWAAKRFLEGVDVDNPDNEGINSEDLKCNTCGDYVGEEGVWGLCETCFDKEGGNEAIEYVYKPLSKEALAEVAQLEPRPNPWLKSQYATEKEE